MRSGPARLGYPRRLPHPAPPESRQTVDAV